MSDICGHILYVISLAGIRLLEGCQGLPGLEGIKEHPVWNKLQGWMDGRVIIQDKYW